MRGVLILSAVLSLNLAAANASRRSSPGVDRRSACPLGGTAAKAITGRKEGVTKMRGKWFQWRDIPVMVTYHPSYLLRPYNQSAKREAWEDLKKVLHAVYD